jgi:peptide/nickel transport system substrate-binding protein
MSKPMISRRAAVAGSIAAGIGGPAVARHVAAAPAVPLESGVSRVARMQEGEVVYAAPSDAVPAQFNEAPTLAEQVAAGTLPPVAERLPKNPLVIQPIEIGKYGGLIRVGNITTNLGGYDLDFATGSRPYFLNYTPQLDGTVLHIASAVEQSEDQTTYTITIRDGLKWSDGTPVTTADIMFWYEDILQDPDLTPNPSQDLRPGGALVKVAAVDDLTFTMTFGIPHPRFLLSQMAHQTGGWYEAQHIHPSHYLKQFHPKYTPEADAAAKAAGYNTWMEQFADKADKNVDINRPTLYAFICTGDTTTTTTWTRNPYYWVVDTDGNQLPYIDTVEMERLQDVESYHARIVSGAYDYAVGNTDILNYSTYEASAADGDYRVLVWSSGRGSEVFFQFNMNYGDEIQQSIHQDVRFRRAMSLAINREEVNQLLFFGAAVPRQMTVLPTSAHFKEDYANAHMAYDVDGANALLDEMGLAWNGDRTVRLRSDGQPLEYNFDYFDGEGPKTSILELITEYWRAIGIVVNAKSITRQLLLPRVQTNEEPMTMWHGDASTDILLPIDRKWVTGNFGDEAGAAPLWNQYFQTDGEEGLQPPEFYQIALDTWTEYRNTLSPDAAARLLQLQADNLWSVGVVGMTPWPCIVRNRIGNVAETGIHTWDGLFQQPYYSETLFIRE